MNLFHATEYVYAVYRERSFSKAALQLNIPLPALSAAIQQAEEELGSPIFDRSASPLALTAFGERYIARLEQLRELQEDLCRRFGDDNGLQDGSLHFGVHFAYAPLLPRAAHRFHRKYPGVRLHFTEGSSAHLRELLSQGAVEAILDASEAEIPACCRRTAAEERLLLAYRPRGRGQHNALPAGFCSADLLQKRHLQPLSPRADLSALFALDFAAPPVGDELRARLEAACREIGFAPRILLEADHPATLYRLACEGTACAVVSDLFAAACPMEGADKLRFLPLPAPQYRRQPCFYYRRGKYMTHALRRFMDVFQYELESALSDSLSRP